MGLRLDCTSIAGAVTLACACATPTSEVERGTMIDAHDEHGRAVRLRIDDVEHGTAFSRYAVSIDTTDGWRPYCSSGARTVVLPGTWDARGNHRVDDTLATFACIDGAIGKCVQLGYAPWASVDGVSLRDAHLACVRMLRADYCGDGTSHTEDGTPIEIWDVLGVVSRGRLDRDTAFEAAWSPDGAVYLAAPRQGDLRDIVARCPSRLAGRTALDLTPEGIAARFPEAVLFDARVIDECTAREIGELR